MVEQVQGVYSVKALPWHFVFSCDPLLYVHPLSRSPSLWLSSHLFLTVRSPFREQTLRSRLRDS